MELCFFLLHATIVRLRRRMAARRATFVSRRDVYSPRKPPLAFRAKFPESRPFVTFPSDVFLPRSCTAPAPCFFGSGTAAVIFNRDSWPTFDVSSFPSRLETIISRYWTVPLHGVRKRSKKRDPSSRPTRYRNRHGRSRYSVVGPRHGIFLWMFSVPSNETFDSLVGIRSTSEMYRGIELYRTYSINFMNSTIVQRVKDVTDKRLLDRWISMTTLPS